VPDGKGRECHAKEIDQEDKKVAWTDHATCAVVARPARAMWHGRATYAVAARPCHLCRGAARL